MVYNIDVYNPLHDIIENPKKYGNISFNFLFSKGLLHPILIFQ
jgi:hypothetical protein